MKGKRPHQHVWFNPRVGSAGGTSLPWLLVGWGQLRQKPCMGNRGGTGLALPWDLARGCPEFGAHKSSPLLLEQPSLEMSAREAEARGHGGS